MAKGFPNYSLIQKNGDTFATVYNSKCVTVFLKQTLESESMDSLKLKAGPPKGLSSIKMFIDISEYDLIGTSKFKGGRFPTDFEQAVHNTRRGEVA